MPKPENSFIAGVHKYLPPISELHREKMANPYSSGTADWWYSGKYDIWIEYKFLMLPKKDGTVIDLMNEKKFLTALQADWLRERYNEGRNVYVITGCSEGGVLYKDRAWEHPITTRQFKENLLSRRELAETIYGLTKYDA